MMKVRNKGRAWLSVLALFPVWTMAQPPDSARITKHAFTIQQTVDYAKKNNVQVKNALLGVQIQGQTNRDVTSAAYPQVNGSGSFVYNAKLPVSLIPAEFFGGPPGTFEKLPFGLKYNVTGGIELNQLLFDGQVFVGLQARSTVMEWQRKNVEVTEELIRANIHKIYYQLVVSKTQISLLDANISRLQKLLNDTREIYKNGFAEKLDISKLEVQLANLNTEKTKALNAIDNGYLGLKMLMGMPMKDELALTDSLSYDQVKEGILGVEAYNYSDRKEVQYAELGKKLGEYNIRRYKLSRLPTASLNGYYNKNAQRNKFNFFNGGDWYSISAFTLRVSVPIFNGFSTKARISKAELELQQTHNQIEALQLSIDNEVITAKNNFRTAIATLDFQKKNMELAEEVYNQTKKKFEAGVGSNIEINGAQTDLKSAQTNYINALYDAVIAKIDFLKATGKL
jgi:outer membrane protein